MNSEERKIILITSCAHGMVHLLMIIFISTNVSIAKEMNLNLFQIGNLGTLSYLAFGLGAIPAGVIVDRFGSRKSLIISLFGLSFSSILIGFSYSPWQFGCSIVLLGIFASIYHPAGLSLISKCIKQQARGMGFHGMGGSIGLAISPFLASYLASLYSWRLSYIATSLPAFAMGMIILFSSCMAKEESIKQANEKAVQHKSKTFLHFIILIFILQIVNGFIYRGSLTFLPTYLAKHINFSFLGQTDLISGGLFSTLALFVGVLGQYLSGEVAHKYKTEKVMLAIMIIGAPFLFIIAQTRNLLLIFSMFSFAFCHFFFQPLGNVMVAKYSSLKHRSKIYGISFACSFSVGALASSFAGFLAEYFNFSQIFTYLGFAWIFMLIISLILFLFHRRIN